MKAIDLYDGITDLPEEMVEAAETHRFRKRKTWIRFAAMAAAFALVIGLGFLAAGQLRKPAQNQIPAERQTPTRYQRPYHEWTSMIGGDGGSGGGENGDTYMAYFGPVMPLTATVGAENVTAVRWVDYDFSPYLEYHPQAIVTDSYTLKNTADRDVTLSLLYPVPLTVEGAANGRSPYITVGGREQKTVIYAGPCTGSLENYVDETHNPFLEKANLDADEASWEAYVAHLADGSYQASAFAAAPNLKVPVIVYKVDDYVLGPDYDGECPTLQISFSVDYEKTSVMTYGVEAWSSDRENGVYACARGSLDWDETAFPRKPMYIVLYGEDPERYTLQGYKNMGCEPGNETDITATVTRYETTMEEFLRQIVDEHLSAPENGWTDAPEMPEREFMYRLAGELLLQYGFLSRDNHDDDTLGGSLEQVFQAFTKGRVLYYAFDVTIPAEESVEVAAIMRKDGNKNFAGAQQSTNGYDLATRLGSTLRFTEQQASVSHAESVVILDNNFGFEQDVSSAKFTLDPAEEHYWMNVAGRS